MMAASSAFMILMATCDCAVGRALDGGHAARAQLPLERVAFGQGFLPAMERIGHEGQVD